MKLIYSANNPALYADTTENSIDTAVRGKKSYSMLLLEIVFLLVALLSTATLFAQGTSALVLNKEDADMGTIIDMQVAPEPGVTTLSWTVYEETYPCVYVIQRATDRENFVPLAKVTAEGAEGTRIFTYTDTKPLAGVAFYRIAKVYMNGSYNFTAIYTVNENTTEVAVGGTSQETEHPTSTPLVPTSSNQNR